MRITVGATLFNLLAVYLSWIVNHSVGYAILHFFCGIFYVIYWLLFRWSGQ